MFSRSSDSERTIRCDPCLSELNTVNAELFCEDCNQYLCSSCIRYHQKFASTQHHVLLDKDTMLKVTSESAKYGIFNIDDPINATSESSPRTEDHKSQFESKILAHIGDINVKTSLDKKDCNITGCALLTSEYLALADNENQSIKILDTIGHKISAELVLTSPPWDVTVLSSDQLAVTLPKERKIQFLDLNSSGMYEGRSIKVDGDCRGISHSKGRLVVTFDSPKCNVEIMDVDGYVIKTISKTPDGHTMFKCPQNIAVTPDGNFIYITDRITCNVTKLAYDGRVIAIYDDRDLCSPEGIVATSDGTVIVCNYKNNMLHLVSPSCKKIKIIRPLSDDVLCPTAIGYCEERNKLYVSKWWIGAHPLYLNHISVYEFE